MSKHGFFDALTADKEIRLNDFPTSSFLTGSKDAQEVVIRESFELKSTAIFFNELVNVPDTLAEG